MLGKLNNVRHFPTFDSDAMRRDGKCKKKIGKNFFFFSTKANVKVFFSLLVVLRCDGKKKKLTLTANFKGKFHKVFFTTLKNFLLVNFREQEKVQFSLMQYTKDF